MSDDDGAIVKKENRRERRAKEGKKAKAGVDNTFRRTWDKDEYEDKAASREKVLTRNIGIVLKLFGALLQGAHQ